MTRADVAMRILDLRRRARAGQHDITHGAWAEVMDGERALQRAMMRTLRWWLKVRWCDILHLSEWRIRILVRAAFVRAEDAGIIGKPKHLCSVALTIGKPS